jgi:hypothetical protein
MQNFFTSLIPDSVGLLKIIYDNDGNETNKTIAVLKHELYNLLVEQDYGTFRFEVDFKIKIYKLGTFLLPPEDRSSNLFIPTIKQLTELYVNTVINNKLQELSKYGILEADSWYVKCPISSRINGYVKQGCFIFFKPTVNIYVIATVRFLLNNTYWDEQSVKKYDNMIKCHWAKHKNKVITNKI